MTLADKLLARATSYRLSGPSAEHTAALLEEAALVLTTVESERDELLREKERLGAGWLPIETHRVDAIKGPYSPHVLCAHFERQWRRLGRYDLALKRWYYSGTDERSQWAQVEGDEPTHWMPLPELSSGQNLADAHSKSPAPSSQPERIAVLCPHAPTYDAGLCCGHPDDCTFVSPPNLSKEENDA